MSELEKIYNSEVRKVYKYFYAKTLSREHAEDLTSATFLVLAEKIAEGEPRENWTKYLYGIAFNKFNEFLRTKYRTEISYDDIDSLSHLDKKSESANKIDLALKVKPFLQNLPAKQGMLLKLRLIDKLTFTEVCEKLGKDANYVKTTQRRGITALKKLIACTPLSTLSLDKF